MKNISESVKTEEAKVKCQNKNLFIKVEKHNDKTMYHTKIMMDIYKFGVCDKKNEFRVSLRSLFNQSKVEEIHLYPIKKGDKFIGMFYGYRKPIRNIFVKYKINEIEKSYKFSKVNYVEFRFKAGSVFCYFRGMARFLQKAKSKTPYNMAFMNIYTGLEKQVYEFYGKKYPEKGIFRKWIEKNLK
ncbi:DUF226 domain-containing protein (plasmid) [Borreliella yangtzensis]|uniref:DUF226 domain-containing protein n=1 Tax=Borreliella yangtzensis TaxID=683292 RepID=UPI003B225A66